MGMTTFGRPSSSAEAPDPTGPEAEGRPAQERDPMMLAGGLAVAGLAVAIIVTIAYKTFYTHTVSENTGIFFLGLAFFPYTGGVFLTCYAWKRGDVAGALKLTLIVDVVSVLVLAAFAIVLTVLARGKDLAGRLDRGSEPGSGGRLPRGLGTIFGGWGSQSGPGATDDEVASQMFTVTCEQCHAAYAPIPPTAVCPYCGRQAVNVA